jgi:hypothetical protein
MVAGLHSGALPGVEVDDIVRGGRADRRLPRDNAKRPLSGGYAVDTRTPASKQCDCSEYGSTRERNVSWRVPASAGR